MTAAYSKQTRLPTILKINKHGTWYERSPISIDKYQSLSWGRQARVNNTCRYAQMEKQGLLIFTSKNQKSTLTYFNVFQRKTPTVYLKLHSKVINILSLLVAYKHGRRQMLCRICCNLPQKAEPKSSISARLFMLLPRFNAALTELTLASKSVFVQVMDLSR